MAAIIGAAGSQIPNIFGGFAPFPNTIATALLAYQSEAIGYGFGIKFQYSKRLIGAMTNEEFNALTPFTIGQIVEAHNTELINRMKLEMPKWLDIQKDFIEASVQVEIAKAERTPSAWVEIIQAFTGAAGVEIIGLIDSLDPIARAALLVGNPLLGLIYAIAKGSSGGGPPPPTSPEPAPEELPVHISDPPDEHTEEEHIQNTLELTITGFTLVVQDPVSLTSVRFDTVVTDLHKHKIALNSLSDAGFPNTPSSSKNKLIAEYIQKLESFYKVTI